MKPRITNFITTWAAVAACGCFDLQLLDNMELMDAGDSAGGDSDSDADADSDGDADGDGPPPTDSNDVEPPLLIDLSCGSGEALVDAFCVAEGPVSASVRFGTDEPAVVEVGPVEGGASAGVLSGDWSLEHHLGVVGLVPEVAADIQISVTDVNGNLSDHLVTVTAQGGSAVAVTEVMADPVGTEPDQEFVEIANLGSEAVDISGWMIDDNGDSNGDQIPDGTTLQPGQVGLLVSPDFDPSSSEDPTPDPGALIIHLSGSLCSSGLKNSEAESVELYDTVGVLVSYYNGQAGSPQEGCSAFRIAAELPDGDLLAWETSAAGASTPGSVSSIQ